MFDENTNTDQDLMMRSILEGAEEEVPAHVWEGVSAGLDKAARTKRVVLWWKRTAVGTAAAAAAVAAVLFLQPGSGETDIVPASEDLIAVVEHEEESAAPETVYITHVASTANTFRKTESVPYEIVAPEDVYADVARTAETKEATETEEVAKDEGFTETIVMEPKHHMESGEWVYDAKELEGDIIDHVRKHKVSLTLSGLTGTNADQNENKKNIFKSPELSAGPSKTGIKQTSTNSTYDIPLSFGAGIRVGLSPKWSIGTGVNYSMLSRKFFGTYTKVNDAGVVENTTASDIRNTQHYIGIPVNAYYDIIDSHNVNLYVHAGGTIEKCITDRYDILGTAMVHKESVRGMQLSANAGIGVSFLVGRHLGIYIDPSLRYYFDCNQPTSIRTAQPLMLGFEVGLKVYL